MESSAQGFAILSPAGASALMPRGRRRLTLAPISSPLPEGGQTEDGRAQGGQTEDGRDAAATEEASSEDEVLRSVMYAGFSSEEASVFLHEKKNSQVSQSGRS